MPYGTATTTELHILLRTVDQEVLAAEARARKQSLGQFVREVRETAAADARQGPVVQLSWLDVYSHRPNPAPEPMGEDVEEPPAPSRPSRPARLSCGPSPHNR